MTTAILRQLILRQLILTARWTGMVSRLHAASCSRNDRARKRSRKWGVSNEVLLFMYLITAVAVDEMAKVPCLMLGLMAVLPVFLH